MTVEPAPQPLTAREERAWRALMRLMVVLPRVIDEGLSRDGGLSLTRYIALMRLSEAPDRSLRMSDLAEASSISPSRMTRIIQPMIAEGLVVRGVVPGDARASLATLTDTGLQRLREAWPAHLAGVRALVMDHIDPDDLDDFHRVVDLLLRAVDNAPGAGCAPAGPPKTRVNAEQEAA